MEPQQNDKLSALEHVAVIEPRLGWHMLTWRELLLVLAMRNITLRYKQNVLVANWANSQVEWFTSVEKKLAQIFVWRAVKL
jgi:hypothetical protein